MHTDSSFKISNWPKQPHKLIVDSSAYLYLKKDTPPPPKKIFFDQMRILEGVKCKTFICPLDMPINPKKQTISLTFEIIEKTLGNTYEFLELFSRENIDSHPFIEPMGVIQGMDQYSIEYCARELKRMGIKNFGLGSLAPLFNYSLIISRVQTTLEIIKGENLHLFGISRLDVLRTAKKLGVKSYDSSRPTKTAIYNGIFYSKPFKTYGIKGSKNQGVYSRLIEEPLPCACPICQIDPWQILITGSKKGTNARVIHNYYHLKKHLSSA